MILQYPKQRKLLRVIHRRISKCLFIEFMLWAKFDLNWRFTGVEIIDSLHKLIAHEYLVQFKLSFQKKQKL